MLVVVFNTKAVYISFFLKSIKHFESESYSTQKHIFQHYCQSYCDYLLKMGFMDEEQAVFEQLTLSDFTKESSTALKAQSQT